MKGSVALRKFNTREFVNESKRVWGDRWTYENTKYVGQRKPVTVTCPLHGEFEQTASSFLKGHLGCSGCDGRDRTRKDFFTRALEVWGTRWDYSKTKYVKMTDSVTVRCPEHDLEFSHRARSHLEGQVGCPPCRGIEMYDTASFIRKSREVCGDRWDYSEVDYISSEVPVTIKCTEHGAFNQAPRHHVLGNTGCPECRYLESATPEEVLIARSKEVWGDRWDYSEAEAKKGFRGNITLRCSEHGTFTQDYSSHLGGNVGCADCRDKGNLTTEEVIRRSKEVWGDRWDYTNTSYTRQTDKVTFTCREHGDFEQYSDAHFRGGVGCSKCSWSRVSKGEKEVLEFVQELGFQVEANVRGLIHGSSRTEVDIWIPEKGVAIEFNGVYYHSERFREPEYHYEKYRKAAEVGISLIQIWEDDWRLNRGVLEEHIRQILGVSNLPKLHARTLQVHEVTTSVAREFLERYHIQGFVPSTVYVGGHTREGELASLAAFRRDGENFLLTRYATSASVRGGHSKLVAYFERNYEYSKLVTFADLTFGSGNLYQATGWEQDGILPPDYRYVVGINREHKFKYRVAKFRNDPNLQYVEGATERELARLNGLYRIYDAGKIRFIKPHPKESTHG